MAFGNPFRENDSTSSAMPYSSTTLSDEESSIQLWQMYNRAKVYLPNQQRMENLTWRMMAYNLKKLSHANRMAEPSVQNSDYTLGPSASSNKSNKETNPENRANSKVALGLPRNTPHRQNSAKEDICRTKDYSGDDTVIDEGSLMVDDIYVANNRNSGPLNYNNQQFDATYHTNSSYNTRTMLQNIEESSNHPCSVHNLDSEASEIRHFNSVTSRSFKKTPSSFDTAENFDIITKPSLRSNYLDSPLYNNNSRNSGIISNSYNSRVSPRVNSSSFKLSSSADPSNERFDYSAHIKRLSQEGYYSDKSVSLDKLSDSPAFATSPFSFTKSDNYQVPRSNATSSIKSALSKASSSYNSSDRYGPSASNVHSQNTISGPNSRGFQLSMDPQDIESFDIRSRPHSFDEVGIFNDSMTEKNAPSISSSFSSNVSTSSYPYKELTGSEFSSYFTSVDEYFPLPGPYPLGSVSNVPTPKTFAGGRKDSFYFDTISNPKDRPNGATYMGNMGRNPSSNSNTIINNNLSGVSGSPFPGSLPTDLREMTLDSTASLSSSWHSNHSMLANNNMSNVSLNQYSDVLSNEDDMISPPSAEIYSTTIGDMRSSQYRSTLNEEQLSARDDVGPSVFGNNGMFSLGEDNFNMQSIYPTSGHGFSFDNEVDYENKLPIERDSQFFDPSDMSFHKSNVENNQNTDEAFSIPGDQLLQTSRSNSSTSFSTSANSSYLSSSHLRRVDTSPSLSTQRRSESAISINSMASENRFDIMSNSRPRKRNIMVSSKPNFGSEHTKFSSSLPVTSSVDNTQLSCSNCYTRTTPLWRKDPDGRQLCNACGLFLKLHGVVRPLSLKTDVIKKRNRSSQLGTPLPGSTSSTNSPTEASGGVVTNLKGSGNKVSETLGTSLNLNLTGSKARRGSVAAVGESAPGFKTRRPSNSSRQRPARPVRNNSKEMSKTMGLKKPVNATKASFDSNHSSRANSNEPVSNNTATESTSSSQNHDSHNFSGPNTVGGSQWEWLNTSL